MKLIPITNAGPWKSNPVSEKNTRYEFKLKLMIEAMKPLQPLLRELISNPDDNILYELVLQENIRRAVDRYAEEIDYSRLLISKGKLPMSRLMSVKSEEPGSLRFSWNDNSGRRGAYWTDSLFVALYHRASGRWFFELSAAIRLDCKFIMYAYSLEGQMADVYAGFVSNENLSVSTSAYLGVLQIKSVELGLRA